MASSEIKQTITMLVHTRIAAFQWGKATVDHFYRQASKYGFSLNVVNNWQEIGETANPIIVLSADGVWISECLKHLENKKIVLLSDISNVKGENIFQIFSDQKTLIREGIFHLRQKGFKNTAFFGVQKNDISDMGKADAFAQMVSSEHVYKIKDDVNETCERFFKKVSFYDSVICANDIIATYLLSECRKRGIEVPKNLAIMGNGSLWISAHTAPPITTAASDTKTIVAVALQTCQNIIRFPSIVSLEIRLKIKLICRESTVDSCENEQSDEYIPSRSTDFVSGETENCKELLYIQKIDRVLSGLSNEEQRMILMLVNGAKYGEIAEQVHLSEDSVKYHIKKIYKNLGIHRKDELISLLNVYGITL